MKKQIAFASLTQAEIDEIADWLRHETYEVVLDRIRKPRADGGFAPEISRSPLERLHPKVALLDLINTKVSPDKKLTLATFESLSQGDILLPPACSPSSAASNPSANPQCEEVHDAIMETVHDLAKSGGNTPTQLLALQRLADFPARAEIREERRQLDHKKFAHKCEMDTFRKETTATRLDLAKQSFTFRQQQHQDRLTLTREKLRSAANNQSAIRNPRSEMCDSLGPGYD